MVTDFATHPVTQVRYITNKTKYLNQIDKGISRNLLSIIKRNSHFDLLDVRVDAKDIPPYTETQLLYTFEMDFKPFEQEQKFMHDYNDLSNAQEKHEYLKNIFGLPDSRLSLYSASFPESNNFRIALHIDFILDTGYYQELCNTEYTIEELLTEAEKALEDKLKTVTIKTEVNDARKKAEVDDARTIQFNKRKQKSGHPNREKWRRKFTTMSLENHRA